MADGQAHRAEMVDRRSGLGAERGGHGDGADRRRRPARPHHRLAPVVPLGDRLAERGGKPGRNQPADLDPMAVDRAATPPRPGNDRNVTDGPELSGRQAGGGQ